MRDVLLTIILPIHRVDDREHQILRIVNEIRDYEIQLVIVEDHSLYKFDVRKLLEGKVTDNIQILQGEFGSAGLARNHGLPFARGEWIAFWDSDDFPIISEFLEMIKMAKANRADVTVGFFAFKDFESQLIRDPILRNIPALKIQILLNPGIWRFAFRFTKVEQKRFHNILLGEDQYFLMECFDDFSEIELYPKVVYRYLVKFPNQLTSQKIQSSQLEETLRLFLSKPIQQRCTIYRFLLLRIGFTLFKNSPTITNLFLLGKIMFNVI